MMNELLPFTSQLNANPFMITMGHSFGAYHDANVAFRYPYLVDRVIGMSGVYDIKKFTGGYNDDNVYFNKSIDFMEKKYEPARVRGLRHINIILAICHAHAHQKKK